jgi:hypothetical protein
VRARVSRELLSCDEVDRGRRLRVLVLRMAEGGEAFQVEWLAGRGNSWRRLGAVVLPMRMVGDLAHACDIAIGIAEPSATSAAERRERAERSCADAGL